MTMRILEENKFNEANSFGKGQSNDRFAQYFTGNSYHLHAPLCVIFAPNSGYIARHAPFIWHRSPTNCDAHLAEGIFQTRSRRWSKTVEKDRSQEEGGRQ